MFTLVGLFFAIAGVGWLRERQDVREHRRIILGRLDAFERKLALLRVGDPLAKVNELFPGWRDEVVGGEGEIELYCRRDYAENPAYINHYYWRYVIAIASGEVSEIERRMGKTSHGDCFGSSGPLYYFGRAWYSSVRAPWSPQLAGAVGAGPAVRPYRDVGGRSPSTT